MTNPNVDKFGDQIDLGPCIFGANLNLLTFRGHARLDQLAAISSPDIFDPVLNPNGTQREIDAKHSRESWQYASTALAAHPSLEPRAFPEIILNARDISVVQVYSLDDPTETLETTSLDQVESRTQGHTGVVGIRVSLSAIEFPPRIIDPQISRVDGNHRLSGADESADDADAEVPELPTVPFSLYLGLSADQELKLFRDINGNHRGMNVTLMSISDVRIQGDDLKYSAKKWPTWVAHELTKPGRAFEGIVFLGGATKGTKKELGRVQPLRLNSLASAVLHQVKNASETGVRLRVDSPPKIDVDMILAMLNEYWWAVRETFPQEWQDKSNYILLQSIGLTAFAKLGSVLFDRGMSDGAVERAHFANYLRAVKEVVSLEKSEWVGVAGAGGAGHVAERLIAAATSDRAVLQNIRTKLLGPEPDPAAILDPS